MGAGALTAAASAVGIIRLAQTDPPAAPGGLGGPATSLPPDGTRSPDATADATPSASADPTVNAPSTAAAGNGFVHPGMLHKQADFDRVAAKVKAGAEPWQAGWARLTANGRSRNSWTARPLETVVRGGTGQNYAQPRAAAGITDPTVAATTSWASAHSCTRARRLYRSRPAAEGTHDRLCDARLGHLFPYLPKQPGYHKAGQGGRAADL